uniref:photosystem I assembly protein Ycf3 n=1 Tax=Cephaleuros diffusus TaxID=1519597 RepID=UPI0030018822
MSAQSEGEYSTALKNYYQSLPLEYYHQALERNPALPQALNNCAVIYHYRAEQMLEFNRPDLAEILF